MQSASPHSLVESKVTFWFVTIVIALVFIATNQPWQLDDYDQAKQAYTSFEMVKDGQWLYQHTPRERIATKPPLVGWISAGIFSVTRSWDLAWRLPSLGAASLLGWLLYRSGRNTYGLAAGLVALGAFGLNLLSPRLATLVRTDMPLALIIFLIGLIIWQKVGGAEPWTTRDRLWIFALLTAGMLIKGPIVYALLLPGLIVFQVLRASKGGGSGWSGWWPWILSLAIFLIWAIGGIQFVPGFYEQVVQREFLGRFGETVHRPQPFYFYLPHVLHKFAPWSVLLIVFTVLLVRSENVQWRSAWREMNAETLWLVLWALGGLIVMSVIPSKRVDRIFPVVPPLCLLLAAQAGALATKPEIRRVALRWSTIAVLFAIIFTAGYSGYKFYTARRDHDNVLVSFGSAVRALAAEHGWRYGAVAGKDEGMIIYLDQTHFIPSEQAEADWKSGKLDAIVVPEKLEEYYRRSADVGEVFTMRSGKRQDERGEYVLVARRK